MHFLYSILLTIAILVITLALEVYVLNALGMYSLFGVLVTFIILLSTAFYLYCWPKEKQL